MRYERERVRDLTERAAPLIVRQPTAILRQYEHTISHRISWITAGNIVAAHTILESAEQ
jgi:hypothetical protein